jgi:short-subunit dehydrogenase
MSGRRPVALITGASSGIGAALARVFAAEGHALVLVARNAQAVADLAGEIGAQAAFPPVVLPLDLALPDPADQIAAALAERDLEPQYVVNSAGFGLLGPAADLDRGEQRAMVDINVGALVDLSLAFVDSLARHQGGILNLSSLAGFMPGPDMAVYYATKAFVLSFTEALHWELAGKGIRVTALCPGPVPTGFQPRAGFRISGAARLFAVSAERVAREGYDGLMRGRRCVVPGWQNKLVPWLPRLLPRGLVLDIMARSQATRTDEARR